MAEFTSLNGYMVKDATARNIAKGRNQAVAFVDYATMIETLNEFEKDEYKAGQNVYIGVVGVPDLWVYSVEDIRHTFEYVSDEDIVEMLKANTTIQVGFFKLAMLEGQKVDLTTYDQKLAEHTDDIAELDEKISNSLTNENSESFNFGVKNGVRGFFTNPSRADDSFIPFSSGIYKLAWQCSSKSNVRGSANLSFVIDIARKCKVLPICVGSGYDNGDIKIAKNGTVIKTITTANYYTWNLEVFELQFEQNDKITITFGVSASNAILFNALVFF